jgi:hypothetical protein
MRMMKLLTALAGLCLLDLGAARAEPVHFVVFGDMPYDWPENLTRFANLIDVSNRLHPDFAVHVGDIKGGGAPCTEDAYRTVLDLLQRSEPPLIYTPGDNEWTDCRRNSAGGYNPIERLSVIRRMFFPPGKSLGRKPMPLEAQSDEAGFAPYVENRRWRQDGVIFATVHVVGSNNNLGFDAADDAEYQERMRAVFAWLDETFAEALQTDAGAVVLFFQADPLFEFPFPFRSGFNSFIAALQRHAEEFPKPILIVHGDSHRLRLDRPLRTPSNKIVRNLVRLIVPGASTIEAVAVTVEPDADPPFAFARVPGGQPLTAPWGGS